MIAIKERNPHRMGSYFDYELENGELLHSSEWNGERYHTDNGIYRPVCEEDENGDFNIIGFEEEYA